METPVEAKKPATAIQDLIALTKDPSISKLYINGFQSGLTLSDANVILMQNNLPIAVMMMPLSAVKSLQSQLSGILENYQKIVGQDVLSIEELAVKGPIDINSLIENSKSNTFETLNDKEMNLMSLVYAEKSFAKDWDISDEEANDYWDSF